MDDAKKAAIEKTIPKAHGGHVERGHLLEQRIQSKAARQAEERRKERPVNPSGNALPAVTNKPNAPNHGNLK